MALGMLNVTRLCAIAWLSAAWSAAAAPHDSSGRLSTRDSTGKMVFCHFMIGVIDDRTTSSDYDSDMQQAKAAGIDAFALNIGVDPYTDTQLTYAYESAAKNGMSVFISFDFNLFTVANTSGIGAMIKHYGSLPAQLKVDDKIFVSSFQGDGLDLNAIASAAGMSRNEIFFAPNFQPKNLADADGLLNWMAWPNNGNNKAPDGTNLTVNNGDQSYKDVLGTKRYIAPVSPWFSTHYGPEVSYSKNWVFPSDTLWFDRWTEILTLGSQFVEIITWNDYGESHYIGPLSSSHIDDGNSKWTNDMPHNGFLQLAIPYIRAFKANAQTVTPYIESDQLIYWYRPHLKSASCDSTDTCQQASPNPSPNYFIGKPNGYETMADAVFVVALLKSAGTVTVTSGSNTQSFNAQAGANSFQVPMGTGKQSFSLTRGGQTVLSGDSLKDIISDCVCGIYNFNAYVGILPPGPPDALQADGLKSFADGMKATCQATPSLGTASGAGTAGRVVQGPSTTTAAGSAPSIASPTPLTTPTSTPSVIPQQPTNAQPTTPSTTTATPIPEPSTPTSASTTTTAPVTGGGGGSKTITALSQLSPTNCMHAGYVWAGPPGSDPAARCEGG